MPTAKDYPDKKTLDAGLLPLELVEAIEALSPDEVVVIERDGSPIATLASTRIVPRTTVIDSEDQRSAPAVYDALTVVATAMKLSEAALAKLTARLGSSYLVVDLHDAPASADVLLVPPISPQAIAALRATYPKARVMVAEFEDEETGVSFPGPVRRLLDVGVENYLASSTIERLAEQLDQSLTRLSGGTARLGIENPHPDPSGPDLGV